MSAERRTPATVSARYRAGSVDTRAAILSASERRFRSVGFRRTTISDVAAELGMSPANVYRFFSSKAAVNEAVAEHVLGGIVEKLRYVADRDDLAPAERLRALLLAWVDQTATKLGGDDRMREMVEAGMTELWEACAEHARQIDRLIRQVIEIGSARGEFTVRNIEETVDCARAAMLRFIHPSFIQQSGSGPTPDQMVAFVLDALGSGAQHAAVDGRRSATAPPTTSR